MVGGGVAGRDSPTVAVDAQVNEVATSDRQIPVDVSTLRNVADVGVASMRTLAKNLEAAGSRRQKAQYQAEEGGFPTAVRAQHGDEFSGVHGKAGVSPDQTVSVGGGHAIGDDS